MNELAFSYLDELNDVQRAAVEQTDGPIMVIAGPGSGKTRVLTYKIAHLINTGVNPGQILALTFTNKAAREMKDRIEKVAGSGAYKVWAGTFHSIFARILRVEAHKIGYPNDFTIYDTDDTKSVINDIIKTMNLDKKQYPVGQVRGRISSAKSNLITPKAYATNDDLMALDRMNRRPMTQVIYEKYVNKCLKSGAMDFDDLLLQMFRLLYQNPENVRQKYQRQFKYLLVDEFQDTNYLQYEILKLLSLYEGSDRNITIVGDDAQSIYSFRGATIENILQFEHDFPDLHTFKLEQNYRSTSFIVNAANEVINFNKRQIPKKIWTENNTGAKIKVIKAMSEVEEGQRVADTIVEQKNRYNLRNSDFSILYRTNAQSRVFEESLRRYNIPYRIYGGQSFYQRKEIKDLIAYIRLTVNDKDDEALKRIINYPRRGIGDTTIASIQSVAEDNDVSMWEVLANMDFNVRAKKSILEFVDTIHRFKKKNAESNAYDTARYIASHSGIVDLLKAEATIEAQNRLENITSLLDGIKEFTEQDEVGPDNQIPEEKSLSVFLQSISLMTDQDNEDGETDVVSMMSIHAAKGLEFKSVFVVGLEENLFPSFQTLSDPGQIDEERRLFYVAITRAESYLCLCYANSRYHFGQMRFNDPSRFIEEISDENIDPIYNISKSSGSSGGFLSKEPKLLGNFKPKGLNAPKQKPDVDNFKPSPVKDIIAGCKVLHLKFGEGLVKSVDERDVATIIFQDLGEDAEKRIMLQYAKLQVLP
jgi:DNA helicase II / ATP-dependent DNA helicase PcrA